MSGAICPSSATEKEGNTLSATSPALTAEQVPLIEKTGEESYFVCHSPAMREIRCMVDLIAQTNLPVLILGETGTGKEAVVRLIHHVSLRRKLPFLKVNCAALPSELLESELFGYEAGAFTGATKATAGKFEACHKGTLLLDEIAEMPPAPQAKLLQVLQDSEYCRLGSAKPIRVDVRVLAATNVDVLRAIKTKKFREDLYYRLNAFSIQVPPLRERIEDIPVLAEFFLERLCADLGRGEIHLDPESTRALQSYSWPGNVRELRNVIERAVLLSENKTIRLKDLHFDGARGSKSAYVDSNLTLLELEKQHIERVLAEEHGRVEKAAKRLGIPRSSLYQKIKKHQIHLSKV